MNQAIDVTDLRRCVAEIGDQGTIRGVSKWLKLELSRRLGRPVPQNTVGGYLCGVRMPPPEVVDALAVAMGLREKGRTT